MKTYPKSFQPMIDIILRSTHWNDTIDILYAIESRDDECKQLLTIYTSSKSLDEALGSFYHDVRRGNYQMDGEIKSLHRNTKKLF